MLVTIVLVISYNGSFLFLADIEDDTEKNIDKYDESVEEDNFTPFSKHISAIDNTQVNCILEDLSPQFHDFSKCLGIDNSWNLSGSKKGIAYRLFTKLTCL